MSDILDSAKENNNFKKLLMSELLWERAAIVSLCLYMASGFVDISMIGWRVAEICHDGILPIMVSIIIGMRVFLIAKKQKYSWAMGIAALGASYFLMYIVPYEYNRFAMPIVLGLALYKLSFSRIMKPVAFTMITALLTNILVSRTGLIANLVYYEEGRVRLCFGAVYCTEFAAYILFIVLVLIAARKKMPVYVMALICFGSAGFVYYFCDAMCSTFCLLLAGVGCLYLWIVDILQNRNSLKSFCQVLTNLVSAIELILMPILVVGTLVITPMYGKGILWISKFDSLINQRISQGYFGYEKYGYSLLGTPAIIQRGNGATTDFQLDYSFIDNSYTYTAIRYGILFIVLICILYVFTMIRIIKKKNTAAALILAIVAIYGFEEHHYIDPWYNIMLFTLFCDFSVDAENYSGKRIVSELINCIKDIPKLFKTKKYSMPIGIIAIVCTIIEIFVLLPRQAAFLRIIVANTEASVQEMYLIITVAVCVLFIFWGVNSWISVFKQEIKYKKLSLCYSILGIVAIITGTIVLYENSMKYEYSYSNTVKADEDFLERIDAESIGQAIFVDSLKDYYAESKGFIQEAFVYDEELSVLKNVTYLCDSKYERMPISYVGFKMLEYADGRMLYTNSDKITAHLAELGYAVSDVYPKEFVLVDDADEELVLNEDLTTYKSEYIRIGAGYYSVYTQVDYDYEGIEENPMIYEIIISYGQRASSVKVYESNITDGGFETMVYLPTSSKVLISINRADNVSVKIDSAYMVKESD